MKVRVMTDRQNFLLTKSDRKLLDMASEKIRMDKSTMIRSLLMPVVLKILAGEQVDLVSE
jgi:hypothetical protein